MKKIGIVALLSLFLAGCQTTNIIDRHNIVVMPSNALYKCPELTYFPKSSTLTDVQAAKFIKTLYANNVQCRNSINAIRKFLVKAQRTVNNSESRNY